MYRLKNKNIKTKGNNMAISEIKKPFLKLMAEKLYRERRATATGVGVEDIRELGLPEDEWQWIKQEIKRLDKETA